MAAPSGARTGTVFELLRHVAVGGLAGLLAGIIGAGIGGRLAMRLAFLIDLESKGSFTDNGFRIGDFTVDGTLELIVFGGLFGGISVGVVWVVVRDFIPRGGWRLPVVAVIAIATGSFMIIDADNIDFVILDPTWAQILILVVLVGLTGVLVAVFDGWLEGRLPDGTESPTWWLAAYGSICLLGVVMAVPTVLSYFDREFCFCEDPPWLAGLGLVVVGVATSWFFVDRIRIGLAEPTRNMRLLGSVGLGFATIAGLAHLARQVGELL